MKIKIPALFLAALLALSAFAGCNSLPPAENPSNSVSAESSPLTEEELENLRSLRTIVHEHMSVGACVNGKGTVQRLEERRAQREENPDIVILNEALLEVIANDPTRDEYYSLQIAEKLQKGMFVNEVYDVLGRPHGLTYFRSELRTNTYTAYVLDNGQVLFLRFVQASVKDYSREELESRVPNFNEKDWEVRYTYYNSNVGWFKLQEVRILDVEELQSIQIALVCGTPEEELPEEYKNGGGFTVV